MTFALPALAVVLLNFALGDDLLSNGDFEAGGRSGANHWMEVYPRQLAQPPPVFEVVEESPHGGKRCVSISAEYALGYTSFTQILADPPKEARTVTLKGWVRVAEPAAGASPKASLMVFFDVPGAEGGGQLAKSAPVTGPCDWRALELEAAVPEGATRWFVRCGISGAGQVFFDDLVLTASREAVDLVPAVLAVAHGDYRAEAERDVKDPWLRVSIPFPLGGQTPLALRVTSTPPDAVASLRLLEERENHPLEVHLVPMKRGQEVKLRVETLALLRDRPLSDGRSAKLAARRQVPKDVRPHLDRAPGLDLRAKTVREIAGGLPDENLGALVGGLQEFLRENLVYAGGASQGAEECLESGQAVCTGYANVAASLLIARGVPTRILACTMLTGRLQEHYVVEAWTPDLGWSRLESTMAAFPWGDSKNLVLRIIYPDAYRSAGDVPLYSDAARGLAGGFDLGEDTCWQGAETVGPFSLEGPDLALLEEESRGAFEELVRRPAASAGAVFAPLDAVGELTERGRKVLGAVRRWVAAEDR